MKFSVIIPCKNSGATILRAVNSVLSQVTALISYEIILVPACPASDTTVTFLDPSINVRVINEPDQIPLDVSRNYGIDAATGDVICFLDADDYYCPGVFSIVASAFAKNPSLEMIAGGICEDVDGKKTILTQSFNSDFYLQTHDQKDRFMGTLGTMWWQIGAYFYKASTLKTSGIRFLDYGYAGEDSIFLATTICTFQSILVSKNSFVVYVLNPSGDHFQKHLIEQLSYEEPSSFKELKLYEKFQMERSALRLKDTIVELLSAYCLCSKNEQKRFATYFHRNHALSLTKGTRHRSRWLLYKLLGFKLTWKLAKIHRRRKENSCQSAR
jgi:glycosyltransferase involved in cell wall biosynthesis